MYVVYFLAWTFILYGLHRLAHKSQFLWNYHKDHHQQVSQNRNKGQHWSNYFLFFDTWKSTIDQWLIEILPTIILCVALGDYVILLFYYIWAVFIQEKIKHNPNFDIYPILTSGKWHLIHHNYFSNNFGVFTSLWDIIFKTHRQMSDIG